jgi:prophage regulatory protein
MAVPVFGCIVFFVVHYLVRLDLDVLIGFGKRGKHLANLTFERTSMAASVLEAPIKQKLIRLPEVRQRVPLSRSMIYLLIQRGEFPKPISLGRRSVAWIEAEIDAWVASRILGNQRDAA